MADLTSILTNIVTPLFAALISGGMTMWGVVRTIKYYQKNAQEQARQAAKPWVFSLDPREHYDYKNAGDILLEGDSPMNSGAKLKFVLRNTDNGIGIIKKFITKNNEYLPVIGHILDKNSVNTVIIHLNEKESLEDMYFIICDVHGNRYKYQAYQAGKSGRGYHIKEIGLITGK